ncbi:AAA domain-containing protein [Stigmatella aurantiaca]|uniref:AAA domain-containing protein n=1 Tax=Stigmatella aurantiaca TaxID=41 RepID=A0A1H7HAE3_STIAU|nr:AAA family ATPase [Stigmatella aurantiaca]SEK47188.1 AAA domain-containing protein [Stigmatella aurantiaca]
MGIRLLKLLVTGTNKPPAVLNFNGALHLVFGPTDTGKSYTLDCLKYALGGSGRPKDIGHSSGYTSVALQFKSDTNVDYTVFRSVVSDESILYEGLHEIPPSIDIPPIKPGIPELLTSLSGARDKKIITGKGAIGNLTAGDLRYFSMFDEMKTLGDIPLVGKDRKLQTRYRSALSLILSGTDDSTTTLPTSTKDNTIARGQVQALDEEIKSLRSGLPKDAAKPDLQEQLSRIDSQLLEMSKYLQVNSTQLQSLKETRQEIQSKIRDLNTRRSAATEAKDRFMLLDHKYHSDLERLHTLKTAASVFASYEARPCPLCHTDISHQTRHAELAETETQTVSTASIAEMAKIESLRAGLAQAIKDLDEELGQTASELTILHSQDSENLSQQSALLAPTSSTIKTGISALSEQRTELSLAIRDIERIEQLEKRRGEFALRTKRQTQKIERNVASDAQAICTRILHLLRSWAVPDVESVHLDLDDADIKINHRQRISYGKGKRGIFLAAYAVALMENALARKHPHLGCVAIDSPLVTYKDPKYGDSEDALDDAVKDKFFDWLANRQEHGQVIILENEEPNAILLSRIPHTEFVGKYGAKGRKGFIPIA